MKDRSSKKIALKKTAGQKKIGQIAVIGALLAGGLATLITSNVISAQAKKQEALAADVASRQQQTVMLSELTFAEIRHLIATGTDRVIIPTGGTEQNGFHMVLGKHNYVVRYTAKNIARRAGKTLVAPVMAYVPEGQIAPPQGHMQFAGTLSLPEKVFEQVLEHSVRSLKAHGFKHIFLLGDSGGNQKPQSKVAARLNAEWRDAGVRVHNLSDYYAKNGQVAYLESLGETTNSIGTHAGIRDSSELFFVNPQGLRPGILKKLADYPTGFAASGYTGAPDRANAELGKALLELKIKAALRQIERLVAVPSSN